MPTSSASTTDSARPAASGGVQSLERAFDLLERMADAGGEVGLSELSASSGLPLPTIHRLMRTLVACGYVRQQPNRRYALGPRLIRLGESASRLLGTWARPYLARLVEETGETANMALLDGDEIVYVAQVPSKHSMRMFTEVGRRVLPHSTGVGKALLAGFPRRRCGRCWAVRACRRPRRRPSPPPRASSPRWRRCAGRGTPSTTTSRRSACAAWRSRCRTRRRRRPSPSRARRAGSRSRRRRGSCLCCRRSRASCPRRWRTRGSGGLRACCRRAGHGPRRAQHTALTPRRRRAPQITRQTDAPNTRTSHLR